MALIADRGEGQAGPRDAEGARTGGGAGINRVVQRRDGPRAAGIGEAQLIAEVVADGVGAESDDLAIDLGDRLDARAAGDRPPIDGDRAFGGDVGLFTVRVLEQRSNAVDSSEGQQAAAISLEDVGAT